MGKSAAANWAGRWARGTSSSVPDRASNPKRRIVATKNTGRMTGESTVFVQDQLDLNDRGSYYSGYSMAEAKRAHKKKLEGN